jgi:hypothetical protein
MNDSSAPASNQIICEYWESPVLDHHFLWLSRQLYTGNNNYFFFENDIDGPADPIYVLTIGWNDTFKISEEGVSSSRMHELLKNRSFSHRTKGRTFKVWNTPLALETCRGFPISKDEYDQMEKFQYVIFSQNETIEFVTFDPPKWEIYQKIKMDDLIMQYLKKDSLD